MNLKTALLLLLANAFCFSVLAQKPIFIDEALAKTKAQEILSTFAKDMNVVGDSKAPKQEDLKAKKSLKDLFYKVTVVVPNDLVELSEEAKADSAQIPMYKYMKYWEGSTLEKSIEFDFNKFKVNGIYINAKRNSYQIKVRVLKKIVWMSDSVLAIGTEEAPRDSLFKQKHEIEAVQDFYIYVEQMYGEFSKFQIEEINHYKEEPFFLPISDINEFWVSMDSSWKKVFIRRFKLDPVPSTYRLNFIKSVDELDFNGETISSFEPFKNLKNLKKLNLRKTGLNSLDFLKNCSKLIELDVSENQLTSLKGIDGFEKLEILYANDNQITEVNSLKKSTALRELYLSNNMIDSVDALISLVNMEKLTLGSNNELHDVTPLRNMNKLQELDISKNKDIEDITFIRNKFEMIRLDIFNTSVPSLEPITNLRRIAYLDCGYTKITSLDPIKQHVYLVSLNISGNKIDDFSALNNFRNIQYFYCSTTKISDISPLMKMTGIREFKAVHTDFTKADIQRFKKEYPRCQITYY